MSERPPTTAVVITRDRLTYTRMCVELLLSAHDVGDIHIVDHGSTYGQMLEWLGRIAGEHTKLDGETTARVHVHWQPNAHPRALWSDGTLAQIVKPDERFIVTDCDVLPPADHRGRFWVAELHRMLDAYPRVVKAGLQLDIDALPPGLMHDREKIYSWEMQYRQPGQLRRLPPVEELYAPAYCHAASVDTTMALYRRLEPFALDPALRTAWRPLQALHLPWLMEVEHAYPPFLEEIAYYRQHAEFGHWREPDGFTDGYGLSASPPNGV